MTLIGFNYRINWTRDFITCNTAPLGENHSAFTTATANSIGNIQAYKNSNDERYYIKQSSVKVEIKMLKSQSWVLSDKKTDKLLQHEQLHYNISALGGRDLERGLLALNADSVDDLIAKKDELTANIQSLINKVNLEYDNKIMWGTDHGRVDLHQGFWETHIAKLMSDPNGELKSIYYMMQR